MSLTTFIREKQKERPLLLMTHLVLGYPSFEENRKVIAAMDRAEVELIELQIPYSEPSADGPILVEANAKSLASGTKVQDCFDFAKEMAESFPKIRFLFMTYYNILYAKGGRRFLEETKAAGLVGTIVPDLPLEEAGPLLNSSRELGLENIFILTPTNTRQRMNAIAQAGEGFLYCVGRRGVTGQKTDFDQSLADQIATYKEAAAALPIALGFGVKQREDLEFLTGKADIAVIGSKLMTVLNQGGAEAVETFLQSLR